MGQVFFECTRYITLLIWIFICLLDYLYSIFIFWLLFYKYNSYNQRWSFQTKWSE
jgi:hypothetical protein